MWRKLWNWLKGIWTWILDLFRPPESLAESPPEPRTLTEAGYERIMRRLLDQLHPDFDQQTLQTFLKDDRISETELVEWLQRAGVRWVRAGGAQRQERLGQLGRQLKGDLAKTAQGLYEHFNGSPSETAAGSPPSPQDPPQPLSPWDSPVATASPETEPETESELAPDNDRSNDRSSDEQAPSPPTQRDQQEVERLFQQGLVLAGSDRRQEAITYWDMAIAVDDTQARLWANRGAVLVDLHLHEQALISLNKALDLQPDEALAWVKRGEALLELDRVEEALPDLEQAVQLDPSSVEAWYLQGRALAQLQRFEAAIRCFDQALTLQPILHLAWIERGKAALHSRYGDLSATGQFHHNPSLNQRGRDGAIASFRAGQRHCTRQDHPLKWQDLQQQIQDLSRPSLG